MVRLTQTVQKGGCAAKVAASELRKILGELRFPPRIPELLVDGAYFDDAAIVRVTPELALVQTLDFFTPVVDSPLIFGKVAAANALSDVYAMGGVPKTAMAILGFPLATMETDVAVQVLQGACDILTEAETSLVGGHSIDDDTLKFGLSVTGQVHPDRIWSNTGAKIGDILILTKAIGTGTVMAALKRSAVSEADISEVLASMMQLNNVLPLLGDQALAVHAATDVTGFGLAGHAMQMARASGVSFELNFSKIPIFSQAWATLREGYLTKAHGTNAQYVKESVNWASEIPEEQRKIIFDPQTSGGLLLSVAPELAHSVLERLSRHFPASQMIGKVAPLEGDSISIFH